MRLLEIIQAAQRGEFDDQLRERVLEVIGFKDSVVDCKAIHVTAGEFDVDLENFSSGNLPADTVRKIAGARKNYSYFLVYGSSARVLVTNVSVLFVEVCGCLYRATPVRLG